MWRDGARTSVSQGVAQHAEGVFHCDSSQRVQRVQKDNVLPQRMPFARDGWADLVTACQNRPQIQWKEMNKPQRIPSKIRL
jgi:hypothetical protein